MCYRCHTCGNISPSKQPQIKKTVPRNRFGTRHKEIAYEVVVCKGCDEVLETMGGDIGKGIELLLKCNGRFRVIPAGDMADLYKTPVKKPAAIGVKQPPRSIPKEVEQRASLKAITPDWNKLNGKRRG